MHWCKSMQIVPGFKLCIVCSVLMPLSKVRVLAPPQHRGKASRNVHKTWWKRCVLHLFAFSTFPEYVPCFVQKTIPEMRRCTCRLLWWRSQIQEMVPYECDYRQARAQISMLPWLDCLTALVNKLLQEMLILFQDPLGQDALACQDSQLVRFFAKDSVSCICLCPAWKRHGMPGANVGAEPYSCSKHGRALFFVAK